MTKLSVIVPTYNAENSLKRCLDSLLKQDVDDGYEIICVDDGSTDGTLSAKWVVTSDETGAATITDDSLTGGVFVGGKVETKTDFDNESVGRVGKLTAAIRPPLTGRVMLGDSEWTAESERPIEVGADVRVVAQQNLTMKVEEI